MRTKEGRYLLALLVMIGGVVASGSCRQKSASSSSADMRELRGDPIASPGDKRDPPTTIAAAPSSVGTSLPAPSTIPVQVEALPSTVTPPPVSASVPPSDEPLVVGFDK